jgi:hypothetical protein
MTSKALKNQRPVKRPTVAAKLAALKRGVRLPVDPGAMHEVGTYLDTDERAVHILARVYQEKEDPTYWATSWANQVKAADFYNAHGLARTLDEILRLDPTALDPGVP